MTQERQQPDRREILRDATLALGAATLGGALGSGCAAPADPPPGDPIETRIDAIAQQLGESLKRHKDRFEIAPDGSLRLKAELVPPAEAPSRGGGHEAEREREEGPGEEIEESRAPARAPSLSAEETPSGHQCVACAACAVCASDPSTSNATSAMTAAVASAIQ